MDKYDVAFVRSARKELESLPARVVERILPQIENLVDVPRPSGCRKLNGERNLWRLRIGNYRVIYSIDDRQHTIEIHVVRHRCDAYR